MLKKRKWGHGNDAMTEYFGRSIRSPEVPPMIEKLQEGERLMGEQRT